MLAYQISMYWLNQMYIQRARDGGRFQGSEKYYGSFLSRAEVPGQVACIRQIGIDEKQ